MINKYVIILLAVGGIALGIATKLYLGELQDHAVTQEKLDTRNRELTAYIKAVKAMSLKQVEIMRLKNEVQSKYLSSVRDLDAFRNREHIVLAKPGLVEIKINKAFNKQQRRLACATGDTALCSEQ
jgi:hypothetical protein